MHGAGRGPLSAGSYEPPLFDDINGTNVLKRWTRTTSAALASSGKAICGCQKHRYVSEGRILWCGVADGFGAVLSSMSRDDRCATDDKLSKQVTAHLADHFQPLVT